MQARIITSLIALICASAMTAHGRPAPDLADVLHPVVGAVNPLAGGIGAGLGRPQLGEVVQSAPKNVLGVVEALEHGGGPLSSLVDAVFGRDSAPMADTATADELEPSEQLENIVNSLINSAVTPNYYPPRTVALSGRKSMTDCDEAEANLKAIPQSRLVITQFRTSALSPPKDITIRNAKHPSYFFSHQPSKSYDAVANPYSSHSRSVVCLVNDQDRSSTFHPDLLRPPKQTLNILVKLIDVLGPVGGTLKKENQEQVGADLLDLGDGSVEPVSSA
ncbi:hypothetical protein BKA70DRAFT_1449313 [Coprinopsis sp. MPI-PUGE-AT-0042]|nr:hypothetical protein BKA70DRAFT_1449313 [Coprinopsis sp. MPI-PUGE-AT-0042]